MDEEAAYLVVNIAVASLVAPIWPHGDGHALPGSRNPIEQVQPHLTVNGKFVAKKSNLWAVRLGYWLGRGYSVRETADRLDDGTTEAPPQSGSVMRSLPKWPN